MNAQLLLGTGFMAILISALLRAAGLATDGAPYIEVHSLEYSVEDGVPYITQNRTVNVDGDILVAKWEAWVYVIDGMDLVEVCNGSDGGDYSLGFKAHRMTFDHWVGQAGCFEHNIPDGSKVRVLARHTWGEGSYREKWSERFIVDKTISN